MKTYFLDTETTGLNPAVEGIVELAIVDENGDAVLQTLVDPGKCIPPEATAVHGITDAMILKAPRLSQLWPQIEALLSGHSVVAYNAAYDRKFFPDNLNCSEVVCAMHRFTKLWRQRHFREDSAYRTINLAKASEYTGHVWSGDAHRALADTQACRTVWNWCEAHERPGINISSNTKGLGGALTNPTEKAFLKGKIKHSYPVVWKGTRFPDVEAAYQSYKTADEQANDQIQAEIIQAKLTQHPKLLEAVRSRGGEDFIVACSHKVGAVTDRAKSWEGQGMQSRFLRNLRVGYILAEATSV